MIVTNRKSPPFQEGLGEIWLREYLVMADQKNRTSKFINHSFRQPFLQGSAIGLCQGISSEPLRKSPLPNPEVSRRKRQYRVI
ncbi:MAG: hypothetical protein EA390_01490 [Balneolaceae bacterium]|nr:MAG: hypothetical protein EA390_01490 [Balneolaceae bacterium]